MKKKVLALFLSAALCVTLLPATGMAAEFGSGDAEIVENAANSQEMFSAEETTEPMGETEQPAEDSMEEETAEATFLFTAGTAFTLSLISSSIVYHSPQVGHFPYHFGDS